MKGKVILPTKATPPGTRAGDLAHGQIGTDAGVFYMRLGPDTFLYLDPNGAARGYHRDQVVNTLLTVLPAGTKLELTSE